MRILLDCDGVLADFVGATLKTLKRRGLLFEEQEVTSTDIARSLKLNEQQEAQLTRAWREPGFASGIKPLWGSKKLVRALQKRGKITVVTAPMNGSPTWIAERTGWLYEHYGLEDIEFTAKKHLVAGDVLIDDDPENIRTFPGRRILVDRSWNRGYDLPRVYSYDEILEEL